MFFARDKDLKRLANEVQQQERCLAQCENALQGALSRIATLEELLGEAEEMMRAERELMEQRDNLYGYTGVAQRQVKDNV